MTSFSKPTVEVNNTTNSFSRAMSTVCSGVTPCAHGVTPEQTVDIAREYEFVVLFTSTVGFENDVILARKMKEAKPGIKIAFVGPHVQIKPDCLLKNPEIDFIVTGE